MHMGKMILMLFFAVQLAGCSSIHARSRVVAPKGQDVFKSPVTKTDWSLLLKPVQLHDELDWELGEGTLIR